MLWAGITDDCEEATNRRNRFYDRYQVNQSMNEALPRIDASDPGLRHRVEEALDTLRPYLQADGGSVRLVDITDDMVVELELLGACESCPMSSMTLRAGIEQAVKRYVPQIQRVEAV